MPQIHRNIAVVTGGTAGVGRAAVRRFAKAGYDVAILARGRAGLDGAAEDVRAAGGRALTVTTDVADADAVDAAVSRIESELGEIDVWVNCAFAGALAYFWDTSPEEYRRMTDVTYYGQVNGTRAALSVMRPRDRGVIINVSSTLADRSIPLQAAYCGAKHAVKGFTESLFAELASEGSSVSMGLVTLPGLNTPQFGWNLNRFARHPMPNPPVYQPEVAAEAIVRMAEHPRRNVWVGIPTALTVLANRLLPWGLDWYLARTGIESQQSDAAPTNQSNLYAAQDDLTDEGARGVFSDIAHDWDPVSLLSATVGRAAETAVTSSLATIGTILDLRKRL